MNICKNPECRKEFTPKGNRKSYCSPECYHKIDKARPRVKKERVYSEKRKHICRWCKVTPVYGKYERCNNCNDEMFRRGLEGINGNEAYL